MHHIVLTPLTNILVSITVAANLFLLVVVLFNGHYQRHAALAGCCIYSVLADPILQQIHLHAHASYDHALIAGYFITFIFMIAIIAEAWQVGEFRIRRWVEIQFIGQLGYFLMRSRGFLWTAYYSSCMLAVLNVAMLFYFCWIFWRPTDEP